MAAVPPVARYPDDLTVPFTEYSDIVTALNSKMQQLIGNVAIRCMPRPRWAVRTTGELLEKLKDEVRTGKSVILQDTMGNVERATNVASLLLKNALGLVFTQIGQFKGQELNVDIKLPGGKQTREELPGQTIHRILFDSLFKPMAKHISIEKVERETFWKDSVTFGMRTKYTRTVHQASLDSSCDFTNIEVFPSPLGSGDKKSHLLMRSKSDGGLLVSYHGLERDAYLLDGHLFVWMSEENFATLFSGKGKDCLEEYESLVNKRMSICPEEPVRKAWALEEQGEGNQQPQ
ncbi:unnamed protein product [Polarella glacialis]|uniref:Uncharacterized protein n=1 Tax=Polarella glacialis TaxID=89957 RepID=A0A813FJL8_POLGL|nr:unnamed protein product [Polarella glacialis]